MNAVPAVRPGLDDRGAATDVVPMPTLKLMPAAASGTERRRSAGGAWTTVAGVAPMKSSVPVLIGVTVEAVDVSWQTGVLSAPRAGRGVGTINALPAIAVIHPVTTAPMDVVMTVAWIAASIVGMKQRATGGVTGVRPFNGSAQGSHSGIALRASLRGRRLLPRRQRMIWSGDAIQHSRPWKPVDRSIASGAPRRCEAPPSFCNCFAMPRPLVCWWRRSPGPV